MIEFLTWVANRQRTYAEAMEAWRSSCPRHTAWEDALMESLIRVVSRGAQPHAGVILTSQGTAILSENRDR